jgi:hypothetical protein
MAGHTERSVEEFIHSEWDEDFEVDEDWVDERYDSYAGERGHSDYGLPKAQNILLRLLSAETDEDKIVLLNHLFDVIHQRSDFAAYMVQGGSSALNKISGTEIGLEESLMSFKQFITESTNTLTLYHGGRLDSGPEEDFTPKKGRAQFSSGLYLTTHYGTAQRYAKGGRKLYRVTVEKGNDADDIIIPKEDCLEFVNRYCIKSKLKEVLFWINKRPYIDGDIFINTIVNNDSLPSSKSGILRKFLVQHGIDYSVVDNAFGWHERMIVLFNLRKILNIEVIKPKDKIEVFDLPTEWS